MIVVIIKGTPDIKREAFDSDSKLGMGAVSPGSPGSSALQMTPFI